jgi:hypothetical protein
MDLWLLPWRFMANVHRNKHSEKSVVMRGLRSLCHKVHALPWIADYAVWLGDFTVQK